VGAAPSRPHKKPSHFILFPFLRFYYFSIPKLMHLPPLHSPGFSGYYSSGDVTIAGDVVIAAGVILRADPGCFIRLEEGVCVGLGAILHAHQGNIIVHGGAILGSGVLVMGWAEIGQRACVGSAVTLFQVTIAPGEVVAPGSLLGDRGRMPDMPCDTTQTDTAHNDRSMPPTGLPDAPSDPLAEETKPAADPNAIENPSPDPSTAQRSDSVSPTISEFPSSSSPSPDPSEPDSRSPQVTQTTVVYGKDYFLQMRTALFS
jgi:carbon dioxide concentrating mechanism protein CcmN